MSLSSMSRHLLSSTIQKSLLQSTRSTAIPFASASSCFVSRRYSSSSSSSNSRNGGSGAAGGLGRGQATKKKARTLDNAAPTVVVVPGHGVKMDTSEKWRYFKLKAIRAGSKVAMAGARPSVQLPSVPPTEHLERSDIAVSTFFALHRPVSIEHPVPGPYPDEAFSSIFDSKPPSMESASLSGIEGEDALSYATTHPISPPLLSQIASSPLQLPRHILQSRFPHFSPPPPPAPIPQWTKTYDLQRSMSMSSPGGEYIYPEHAAQTANHTHGKRHIIMITHSEISDGELDLMEQMKNDVNAQPFLKRMWERRRMYNENTKTDMMHTLSVRRQRKLKMKKHKYKKLRRKTRAERRRLDK